MEIRHIIWNALSEKLRLASADLVFLLYVMRPMEIFVGSRVLELCCCSGANGI